MYKPTKKNIIILSLVFLLSVSVFSQDISSGGQQEPDKKTLITQLNMLKQQSAQLLQILELQIPQSEAQAKQLLEYKQQLAQVSIQLATCQTDLETSQTQLQTAQTDLKNASDSLDSLTTEFQTYKNSMERKIKNQQLLINNLRIVIPITAVICVSGGIALEKYILKW